MATRQAFLDALVSTEPSTELANADDLFGFLIGTWEPDSFHYSAEKMGSDGKSWQLCPELFGKRAGS